MSTMPWGTMNGWLRLETEQRGAWRHQRVQDLRAAKASGPAEPARVGPAATARPATGTLACA